MVSTITIALISVAILSASYAATVESAVGPFDAVSGFDDYDLIFTSTGGSFRATVAMVGYANLFAKQLGLFNESGTLFQSISASSGASWWAMPFFFAKGYYDAVIKGTPEDMYNLLITFFFDYNLFQGDGDFEIEEVVECVGSAPLLLLPGFEIIPPACGFFSAWDNDWALFNHGFLSATMERYGEDRFGYRSALASDKIPALQSTDAIFQMALSNSIRVGNKVTFYGPDRSDVESNPDTTNPEVYRTELPIVFVVQDTSQAFEVASQTGNSLKGYVYSAPENFESADYRDPFGLFPIDDTENQQTDLTARMTASPEFSVDWQTPWANEPSIADVTASASATLGLLVANIPVATAQYVSYLLNYVIPLDKDATADTIASRQATLLGVTDYLYQSGVLDKQNICSTWPVDCGLDDSALIETSYSDPGSLGQTIGLRHAAVCQNDEADEDCYNQLPLLKVIYVWQSRPGDNAGSVVPYFRNELNMNTPPGGYHWPPTIGLQGFTPNPSTQIFDETLEVSDLNDRLAFANFSSSSSSDDEDASLLPPATTIVHGTTVDNPLFGVKAGQRVEIFIIRTNSDLDGFLFTRPLTLLSQRDYASLARSLAANDVLAARLKAFLNLTTVPAPPTPSPTEITDGFLITVFLALIIPLLAFLALVSASSTGMG